MTDCLVQLTPDIIGRGLSYMLSSVTSSEALALSLKINSEDGVSSAARSFYSHLHVENMICDISIFLGESQLAHVWCQDCGFKMTREVCDVVHGEDNSQGHRIFPCSYMNWTALRGPTSAAEGVIQGIGGATHELAGGLTNAFIEPVSALYKDGIRGAMGGIVSGLQGLIVRPITGGFVLYNKFSEGLKHMQSPLDSGHPSLPDPNLQFARLGAMERQEASIYGTGAFLPYGVEDCLQESTASVVSLEAPGHNRTGNALDMQDVSRILDETILTEAAEDPSDTVSSDVLALDKLMHSEIESQSLFDSTSSLNSPILHLASSFSPPPKHPSPSMASAAAHTPTSATASSSPDGSLLMTHRSSEEGEVRESLMIAGALESDAPEIDYTAAMAGMQSYEEEDQDDSSVLSSGSARNDTIDGVGVTGGRGRRVDEFGFEDTSEDESELQMSKSGTIDMNTSVPVFAGLVEVSLFNDLLEF